MKCPACPTTALVMTDRSGIEIDYCPDCRGVWLDRGELDKIIERAAPAPIPAVAIAPAAPYRADRDDRDDRKDRDDRDYRKDRDYDDYPAGKRKKKGLLGDLFDF